MSWFLKSRARWLAAGLMALMLLLSRCNSYPSGPITRRPSSAVAATKPAPVVVPEAALMTPVQHKKNSPRHPARRGGHSQATTLMPSPQTAPPAGTTASAAAAPSPVAHLPANVAAPIELLLGVHINQQPWHETDLFLGFGNTPNNNLYAKGSDLERWRLRLPAVTPYLYQEIGRASCRVRV